MRRDGGRGVIACPHCGSPPSVELDVVIGEVGLWPVEGEGWPLVTSGDTELDWDGQTAIGDGQGGILVACQGEAGHLWWAPAAAIQGADRDLERACRREEQDAGRLMSAALRRGADEALEELAGLLVRLGLGEVALMVLERR